jgi:prepilin-type N-terminal cleavage/methylation domain-containing protein
VEITENLTSRQLSLTGRNNFMYTPKNTSGFTLVEMVLATTIFAIMSVIILSIYIQTTALSSRLKATRYLSETSREITEMIAEDVRTLGLTGATISASPHIYWNGSSDYTQSGTEILGIGDGMREYIYGLKTAIGIDPCDALAQQEAKTHC